MSGERVLEHARCEFLTDSVALVIALTVAAPDDDARRNDKATQLRLAASAHASALFGTLPKPALGVGAALAIEALSLRVELRGAFHLPQSTTFDNTTLGAKFNLVSVAARGCWSWGLGAVELGPCVGADIQYISASGFGGEVWHSRHVTSWGPALAAFGRVRFAESFGIVVVAEGAIPVVRRRFVFSDVGVLHRASPVAAQLLIAPEVHF